MKGVWRGYYWASMLIVWISISVSGPLVVLSRAPGSVCAFWRLLISSIIVLPLWTRSRSFEWLQCLAGLFLGLHFITWMESLYLVPVGVSTAIVVAYPAWSLVIDKYVLHEPPSLREATGIFGAVAGIILYFSPRVAGILNPVGLLLSLLGSLFAALYFSIGRYYRWVRGRRLGSYVFPVYASAMIATLIYNLILGVDLVDYDLRAYASFIALALVPMLGGHTLMNYLLGYARTSRVTSIALAEPVGASIISYMVFGQGLTPGQITSMIIIIVSLMLAQSSR